VSDARAEPAPAHRRPIGFDDEARNFERRRGFYHDGRFPTLEAVIEHYDKTFDLDLTDSEKLDLVQYLKSL
jgi:hypothetical protein